MREFSGNILEIRKKDVEVCLYNGATKRKFPDTAKIFTGPRSHPPAN